MAEEAKNVRRVAKSRFTRKRNELLKSISSASNHELVENNYAQFLEAWNVLETKHDLYAMLLSDDAELEAAEIWINKVQEEFTEATKAKINFINHIADVQMRARAETEQRDKANKEREQMERFFDQAMIRRETARAIFETACQSASHTLSADKVEPSTAKKLQKQIDEAFAECKLANSALLDLSTRESAANEIKWLQATQAMYNEMNTKLETHLVCEHERELQPQIKGEKSNHLQLEKIKMPRFEGELREYPSFKRDFQKQVMPHLTEDTLSYTLRSCLGKEPLAHVKSVDDDVYEMWKRLDEKYGDPAKVADVIINEIRRVRSIREGENKRFIELVGIIEDGYRDLKRLGLEAEITTTSSVSIIERKLPPDVRKEWAKLLSSDDSTVDKTNKFPSLLKFLLTQKRAIEYDDSDLRAQGPAITKAVVHYATADERHDSRSQRTYSKCVVHENSNHLTKDCRVYLDKTVSERLSTLKEKGACFSCLRTGHRSRNCRSKKDCGVNECKKKHHPTLHEEDQTETPSASAISSACSHGGNETCILQLQQIKTSRGHANVLWDNASSISLITRDKAREERLRGTPLEISLVKVGGKEEKISSRKYKLPLIDLKGETTLVEVCEIDKITTDIQSVNMDKALDTLKIQRGDVTRPKGAVDVLIGYDYAGFHPVKERNVEHLMLLKNRFGRCIGGTHPSIREKNHKSAFDACANHLKAVKIDDFYNIERLGVSCTPRCGGCKCGKCAPGTSDYTLKEERELHLIEKGLEFNEQEKCWIAEYPWIRDPHDLPDNKRAAFGRLLSTERRLLRNPEHSRVYQNQVEDMVERGVARKLSKQELETYKGPIHYISHHDVLKPDSKSTPVRIVFNSSANYMGHVLNEYWAKGPDLLNNLVGILVRFREHEIGFIGDVKKMYHTVKTKIIEQHTHRFLWRDMNTSRDPDTYVIQRVSFGDKPSGTIATVAMRKTAELSKENYPQAANTVISNSYMDDIVDSVHSDAQAKQLTNEIEAVLVKGGFKIKGWFYSNDKTANEMALEPNQQNSSTEKVLGVIWSTDKDQFRFKVGIDLTLTKAKGRIKENPTTGEITKRIILSQINRVYDPLGLAAPVTVRAKILMRQLWATEKKLGWDDPVPEKQRINWLEFFQDLRNMDQVIFPRCLKPSGALGLPTLIIFSDGSDNAYGACAYIRWTLPDNKFETRLIMSKNRLSPNRKLSIDRIELCAAVLSKRLKNFLDKESRYKFAKYYHIVDSQIVHGMIQKESYGYNTFAATRIGEIQEGTNPQDWYWVESDKNIADWITRGKRPSDIKSESDWQKGPRFLQLPESEWPISKVVHHPELPMKTALTTLAAEQDSLARRIDINRHSSYNKLLRVTARVLAMYAREPVSLKNATKTLTPDDISKAERFWIIDAQRKMLTDVKKSKYKRLCPKRREDGVIVVGHRTGKWVHLSYDKREVILIPREHRFSKLYAEHIHRKGHHGVSTTVSKIRLRFWIPQIHNIVKSIRYNCVTCKKLDENLNKQVMGQLPEERLMPSPPWHSTAIDLFGPFKIRDQVKKRTIGKCYGVLFNCMSTRAVHIDLVDDYSTEAFLLALRRFTSLRGYPAKLYSDNGPQLVAASEELQNMTKKWNLKELKTFGVNEGLKWEFASADAPWQNGISEALIKSIKRAITTAIGQSVMTFPELQTVLYEVSNLVNERPIGRHPTSPEDGAYLCPNDILLGRSSTKVPNGPFNESADPRKRFYFIQNVVDAFWSRWTRDYFPSLLVRQKWHTCKRDVMVGDIVLIQDSNQIRGKWKLGRVIAANPGKDGKIRKVTIQYKNPAPNEKVGIYKGRGYSTIERPVQRLIVLVPFHDDEDSKDIK